MTWRRTAVAFLTTLLGVSLITALIILLSFWRPIVFAAVFGIGFYPLHGRINKLVPGRNTSALISTMIVLLIFVLPAVLVAFAAHGDLIQSAQRVGVFSSWVPGQRIRSWLEQYVDLDKSGLRSAIDSLPAKMSQLMLRGATSLVKGLLRFLGEGVVALIILFFVFRDGAAVSDRVASLVPLNREHVNRLFARVQESVFANLYGILAVAFAQGVLTGAAFALLGIPSPVLFGIVAGVFSLLPLVGTSLVWLPASVILLVTGHQIKGLLLLVWGAIVVGSADNIIRPLVVMRRVKLHPLVLLFALIGGVTQFGFAGLFIGPLVMSLIVPLADMLREEVAETKRETAPP